MTGSAAAALTALLLEHRPSSGQPGNILGTLLSVQQAFGHVPPETVLPIAEALGVAEAEVAGVLSYYPDLHTRPRGRHVIRLCMGEACVANRSQRLLTELRRQLGIGFGETTKDERFALERVYCLGNCAVGPTVMVDEVIHGRIVASALCDALKNYP